MIDCHTIAERLEELLDGDLEPDVEQAALLHLATCADCEQVLNATRRTRGMLRDHAREQLPDEVATRLLTSILASVRVPEPDDP